MDINADNYYSAEAARETYSASQIKAFLDCEARELATIEELYQEPPSIALTVGSYVDQALSGDLDAWILDHQEIFNKRTGELKAEYKQADAMVFRALSDPVFAEYIQGEKQRIFTGKIAGLPFRAKLDFYVPGVRIVDLKTCKDFKSGYAPGQGRLRFDEIYHYPLQLAIYQELVYQNTGEKLPCFLACITKEDPPDIRIFQYDQAELDTELEILKQKLPRIDAVKHKIIEARRCESCRYCRKSRVLKGPQLITDLEAIE